MSPRNYTRYLQAKRSRRAANQPVTPTYFQPEDGHQKIDAGKKARLAALMAELTAQREAA